MAKVIKAAKLISLSALAAGLSGGFSGLALYLLDPEHFSQWDSKILVVFIGGACNGLGLYLAQSPLKSK